jgi:phosphoglycerol transferase MdoB-like AlkP superfamily enzyme
MTHRLIRFMHKLKPFLFFYFRYIVFFLAIQMLFRIIFLIIYHNLAKDVGIWDQLLTLAYGMKLDISVTGYILMFPTLVLIVFSAFNSDMFKKIIGVYTFLILLLLVPAYFTNLVIYKYWKTPTDSSILDYISTPKEMVASISTIYLLILILMMALIIYALHFKIYRAWVTKPLQALRERSFLAAAMFLLLFPSLIIPIRGGLATSPINTGVVYFHQNTFVNHAAVNPVWNLVYSITEKDQFSNVGTYYPDEKVKAFMEDLYPAGDSTHIVLSTKRPNVILIFLESFGQPFITALGGDGSAAPNLNTYLHEGIFFQNFYCSGEYTDRAIAAILSGYPSLPNTGIIRNESKSQKLPGLNHSLIQAGYSSSFLYGGDIDFGHIRSFLVLGEFESIISDKSFPAALSTSNWGVPDHHLFRRLIEESDKASSPFFHVLLTLSSHAPYDVPMEPVFAGSDQLNKFKNSVYYTDRYLGEFIETAKTKDWWKETLVVLVADHGCRLGDITAYEKRKFNVPMLWLGGALNARDTIIHKIGSQTDIPVTILNQLGLPSEDFQFGKDLLSNDSKSFAYYAYSDGIGFLLDSSYSIYNLITEKHLQHDHPDSSLGLDPGLAFLQYLVSDYKEK